MTTHSLLLEQIEDRWIGHVADLPGCFGNGRNLEKAVAAAPAAIEDYARWRSEREPGFTVSDISVEVTEKVPARHAGEHEINAFFEADRPPLTSVEMAQIENYLAWTRESLLRSTLGLHDSHLRLPLRGERWPIVGVLEHVADAENWYLDRIGRAIAKSDLPEDAFRRLSTVRKHLLTVLPELCGDDHVVERDGELWSARKIVRRALWHERDHTAHIRKMRAQLES